MKKAQIDTGLSSVNAPSSVTTINLDNHEIKRVEDFKYLGSKLKSSEVDFRYLKSLAWAAYWKMEAIWKAAHIPIKPKASGVSVLLYGSETWIVTSEMGKKLNSFATTCYRI